MCAECRAVVEGKLGTAESRPSRMGALNYRVIRKDRIEG